jgi:hypothetical protein
MVSRPFTGLAKKMFFSKSDAIDLPDYHVSLVPPAGRAG